VQTDERTALPDDDALERLLEQFAEDAAGALSALEEAPATPTWLDPEAAKARGRAPELRRAHEAFCRAAADHLLLEHRLDVELRLAEACEEPFAEACERVPADALAIVFGAGPARPPVLLAAELPFLRAAVGGLLGAPARDADLERPLTHVDLRLARRVLLGVGDALAAVWREHAGVALHEGELCLPEDLRELVPGDRPCGAVAVRTRLGRVESTLVVLTPHEHDAPASTEEGGRASARATEVRASAPAPARASTASPERPSPLALADALAPVSSSAPLRAALGGRPAALAELAALRAGAVVPLGVPDARQVVLLAEGTAVRAARAGRWGTRRAALLGAPSAVPELPEVPAGSVRVWAELGTASLPVAALAEHPEGHLLELDADADAPVTLRADDLPVGRGRLVVGDDGELALEVDDLGLSL